LSLRQKLYAQIDEAPGKSTDEFLLESCELINKVISWLQKK
jgi:hypothetical protein